MPVASDSILTRLLHLLLSAALFAMLFPLQPEPPCAKPAGTGAQPDSLNMLAAGQATAGLLCEQQAKRLQLCDLLPFETLSCPGPGLAVAPAERLKSASSQSPGLALPASVLLRPALSKYITGQNPPAPRYSSWLTGTDPARAPPRCMA